MVYIQNEIFCGGVKCDCIILCGLAQPDKLLGSQRDESFGFKVAVL